MQISQMTLGMYQTNCYILNQQGCSECVLIDPADEPKKVLAKLEQLQLTPVAVLLTHGHYDHILAVPALQQKWPELPVYCHELDRPDALTEEDMGQTFPTVTSFKNLRPLQEGETLELGGITFQVLHTPGHTPGSVTFAAGKDLFVGDTLFRGSIGRTDFAGGDDRQMAQSLARLAALPGDYNVYPGHEGTTTLERERRMNPWLSRFCRG